MAQWVKALSTSINGGNFLVFIRVIRGSVADGDESGSPCGYEVRCLAANPCNGILCCADSFYSAGHGGAFCFSPCYTTSLVCSFFLCTTSAYTSLLKGNFYSKILGVLLKGKV